MTFRSLLLSDMLDLAMPILMFYIAFGLSMDYEVFLVTHIQEEVLLRGVRNRVAVAVFIDAIVIHPLVVPSFIHLAGRANWWLPAVLPHTGGAPGARKNADGAKEPTTV